MPKDGNVKHITMLRELIFLNCSMAAERQMWYLVVVHMDLMTETE